MKAIVRSRQLLANSEALLSYPEYYEEPDVSPTPLARTEQPATSSLPIVCKRDFGYEHVTADGKHFCECTFRNCTLLYGGSPVAFESCQFHDCRFEFSGAAGRTVQFLECFGLLAELSTDPSDCESVDAPTEFVN